MWGGIMSECLTLLMITLQSLIYSQLFNENLCLVVKNSVKIDLKKRGKSGPNLNAELGQYRKLEKDLAKSELEENKTIAETLVWKSQKLPSKRHLTTSRQQENLKKTKREYVTVMNEEFPVYKTTKFVEEVQNAPIFSREETMPKVNRSSKTPKEGKNYVVLLLRVNKIAKTQANICVKSIQNIILSKSRNAS